MLPILPPYTVLQCWAYCHLLGRVFQLLSIAAGNTTQYENTTWAFRGMCKRGSIFHRVERVLAGLHTDNTSTHHALVKVMKYQMTKSDKSEQNVKQIYV